MNSDSLRAHKKELRKRLHLALDQQSPDLRQEHSSVIAETLLNLPELRAAKNVMLYSALPTEVDTQELMQGLWAQKKRLVFPNIEKSTTVNTATIIVAANVTLGRKYNTGVKSIAATAIPTAAKMLAA